MQVVLPRELEEEFRKVVGRELGANKGNLSLAVQEAIKLWIDSKKI